MPRNPASQNPKTGRSRPAGQEPPATVAVAPASPKTPLPPKPAPKKVAQPTPKPRSEPNELLAEEIKLLGEEVDREKRLAIAQEQLLFRRHNLLAEGGDLTVDEFRLLEKVVPELPHENHLGRRNRFNQFLRKEDTRVGQILDLQERAGSPVDRKAADELAAKKADELAEKGPRLEEQIRDLQSKLGDLHQASADANSAAAARHAADENLRDTALLPRFVTEEFQLVKRRYKNTFGKELLALESRRVRLTGLITLDASTPEGIETIKHHVSAQSRFGRDEMDRLRTAFNFVTEYRAGLVHRFTTLRPGVWGEYINELREELVSVEGRIDEITDGELAEANAQIEKLNSFYCLK